MTPVEPTGRLDRPVDPAVDHVLGPLEAPITLVEYGSYACPHCRAANERVAELRDQFGDRMRYVFRHRPLPNNDLARRAAELAERAEGHEAFWKAHVALMTRSPSLTEDDLRTVAAELAAAAEEERAAGPGGDGAAAPDGRAERPEETLARRAKERVDADERSADRSGVRFTPTFFINGRRYDGLWQGPELADALLGSLGHRVRAAALDFARWAPSAGLLLLGAAVLAVLLTNTVYGPAFTAFWQTELGIVAGEASFRMPLLRWINDGLLSIFFLVVGLEIKREFTVGHLATVRSAAFPVAAAVGGMVAPALLYRWVVGGAGPWGHGWGVPIATDTAFAVALIVMLGRRVPIELRIFLTAAAIVDDIGAITVVALFYSEQLRLAPLLAAGVIAAALGTLNHFRVHRVTPYVVLGVALWAATHAGGLHATLAGVILAFFIPTRQPPNLRTLMAQAETILMDEARRGGEVLRLGPSADAMRAMDQIHDRLESPADRVLRTVSGRSSYVVLPVFALANAGALLGGDVLTGRMPLAAGIGLGLVAGKPLGLLAASALAVRMGLATKPGAYGWMQVAGAGALAGIGFTMSLFIASEAFPDSQDFAAAKLTVFAASMVSAVIGVALLWRAGRPRREAAAHVDQHVGQTEIATAEAGR